LKEESNKHARQGIINTNNTNNTNNIKNTNNTNNRSLQPLHGAIMAE
jgi:hypothetical protein